METFHAWSNCLEIWRETEYKSKKNLSILQKDRYIYVRTSFVFCGGY